MKRVTHINRRYSLQKQSLINWLILEKEKLKEHVLRNDITWQQRLGLYDQLKSIKEEIKGYQMYQAEIGK